jgi:hypothetical protein
VVKLDKWLNPITCIRKAQDRISRLRLVAGCMKYGFKQFLQTGTWTTLKHAVAASFQTHSSSTTLLDDSQQHLCGDVFNVLDRYR